MLEAARQTVPPSAFLSFVATLLFDCSNCALGGRPVTLKHVITCTTRLKCPGISRAHLVAFQRHVWPRHATIAELEQYSGILPGVSTLLRDMDPSEYGTCWRGVVGGYDYCLPGCLDVPALLSAVTRQPWHQLDSQAQPFQPCPAPCVQSLMARPPRTSKATLPHSPSQAHSSAALATVDCRAAAARGGGLCTGERVGACCCTATSA